MATSAQTAGMWRDPLFGAGLAAGPIFWVLLSLLVPPAFDPTWPLRETGRFLLAVLAYPVLEEIVFRGGLQPWLCDRGADKKWWGFSAANVLTSIFFAAFHLVAHTPAWAVAVFIPSLILGYFYDRHNSLTTPIVLHVFYNAGYFWLFAAI